MNDEYTLIILLTLFGFIALAVLLLAPVYLFLKREQKVGDQWTQQLLGQRPPNDPPATNGSPHRPPSDAPDPEAS